MQHLKIASPIGYPQRVAMHHGLGSKAQERGQASVNREAPLLVVGNYIFQCHSSLIAVVILVPRNLK
jgi:hypothetical protein